MNGNYLIPANSKKSSMILGLFTPVVLLLFASGVTLTVILMLAIHTDSFGGMILILLPGIISAFLVFPVPNYHNVLQLIVNIYSFFTGQREYRWKGWCYKNGDRK